MDEKLLTQIRLLKKYLELLKDISKKEKDEYLKDEILRGAAERYLQLAIETCINIGARIVLLEQFKRDFKSPETYSEIFEILSKIGFLDESFAKNLKNMAKFRNKLVHMYWEIDDEFVFYILQTNLSDIQKFLHFAMNYITEN
ncbi:type VII toxin-antitoxin system HepT family RNase toxin [Caloramator australicus]|uniref:DUF86 domain-containing protein n=1 Tax=Caloramator australicus RC3 TaxID=857293 RepID=G0V4A9_9CLOT|nr:DUF86 domain-containing protein [Caloramator australicus]CCC57949.1 hypothetical protein CAAU_0300 [Caloramator australicus RC3]